MTAKVRKAIFPVAGMGTRFLPVTKAVPKEMLPVVDKPLIQYAVEEAQAAGIEEFIFVTAQGKPAIESHFNHAVELEALLDERGKHDEVEALNSWLPPAANVVFTFQPEPLGLGHAVWCARDFIEDEPFAVLLPDDLILADEPCLSQMVKVHEETGGNVVAAMDVPREHTSRFGVIDPGSDDGRAVEIKGLVEKPAPDNAPSTLCVIGRYILLPEVFDHLDKGEKGAGDEIQLTDAMAAVIGKSPFHGLRFSGTRFDCGEKVGYLAANVAFGMERDETRAGLAQFLNTLELGN